MTVVKNITTSQDKVRMLLAVSTAVVQTRVSAIIYERFYFIFLASRLSKIWERKREIHFQPTEKHVFYAVFLQMIPSGNAHWRMHSILHFNLYPSSSPLFVLTKGSQTQRNYSNLLKNIFLRCLQSIQFTTTVTIKYTTCLGLLFNGNSGRPYDYIVLITPWVSASVPQT